ncbi:hypothetical protein LSH36_56g00011 [Paralvinella palmiformis]|uniref:Uncharacterized protein n=1 Tax=Paralvinella palmiformis TaxID=53620 RepID=A0AAD9NCJ3_9ANNE|nr:hypothetical protein LSH36_56g00011 [Paralvinella palmiformis]
MAYTFLTFLFALDLLFCYAQCFGNNYWKLREVIELSRHHNYHKNGQASNRMPFVSDDDPYVEHYITQPLDHFDASVKNSYKQRYWVNSDYWLQKVGPVFLYIGGEASLSSLSIMTGEHVDLAKQYKALILSVEHRYYGLSLNSDSLHLKNMKYLSSQQAPCNGSVAESEQTVAGGTVPTSGEYPHLVYAAVASSAPVRATVNFEGYNEVVAASLSDPIINGSTKCALNVKSAFKVVDLKICNGELKQLASDFLSCESLENTTYGLFQFVSNLADVFMGTVQYNDEKPGVTVTKICDLMTQPGDPYDNFKILNKLFLNLTDQKCADNSWKNAISQIQNTTVTGSPGVGIRQWTYQTCAQFGYYQTCDKNTTCLFSHHMSLGPNLDICAIVFNISADEVTMRTRFTNDYYGSDKPKGTRIMFVNGSVDPWHALSVVKDLSDTEIAIYIHGTAHCANMYSDKSTDLPALQKARLEIANQIGLWLAEASHHENALLRVSTDNTLYFRSKEA